MGWLKLGSHDPKSTAIRQSLPEDGNLKSTIQHVENVRSAPKAPAAYSNIPLSTLDTELPFIAADEVMKRTSAENGGLRT
jgi:hypothetical protein